MSCISAPFGDFYKLLRVHPKSTSNSNMTFILTRGTGFRTSRLGCGAKIRTESVNPNTCAMLTELFAKFEYELRFGIITERREPSNTNILPTMPTQFVRARWSSFLHSYHVSVYSYIDSFFNRTTPTVAAEVLAVAVAPPPPRRRRRHCSYRY